MEFRQISKSIQYSFRVYLTGTRGGLRTAISNGFGRFSFDEVTVGETYIISVASKRYTFAPVAISPTESTGDLNLIAEQ